MARYSLIAVLGLVLVASPVFAGKLYKWVDEAGNVTYQDRPPPAGEGRVEERELPEPGVVSSGDPAAASAAAKAPVTLYLVPGCAACEAARFHLKERGVSFSQIDVSERNVDAQQKMIKRVGNLAVPTIVVGTKVMKGYMGSLLDGELDAAGYPKSKQAGSEGEEPVAGEVEGTGDAAAGDDQAEAGTGEAAPQ